MITDPLLESPTYEQPGPILAPYRLTGAICQIIVRQVMEFDPPALKKLPAVDASPGLMLIRYLGGYLFGWNPIRRTYEVRDEHSNQLLFFSQYSGRDIVLCDIQPMALEKVWEDLNAK